jgi:serine O-acetyltransferase
MKSYREFYHFETSLLGFIRGFCTFDSFTVLVLLRLRAFAFRHRIPVLSRLVRLWLLGVYGVDIDPTARIGTGVIFMHTVGIVIGGDAAIGEGCMLMGSNTLGTNDNTGYPSLGKGVLVGAGARLIGPIIVGDGAKIGANAVITVDVPAGATAVGYNKLILKDRTEPA